MLMRHTGIPRELFMLGAGIMTVVLLAAGGGCGGKANRKPPLDIDAVREQYEAGIRKLRQDDLKGAEQQFRGILELDDKSPYGYAGMGLLELVRTNYDDALSYADRAIEQDASAADAHAVRGRVLSIRKKGRNWFEDAMVSFRRALDIAPSDQRSLYFAAECCLKARRYTDALEYYTLAAGQTGQYENAVADRVKLLRKIIEAGELSDEGSSIALDDKIDRADLAALLVRELQIARRLRERRPELFSRLYNNDLTLKGRRDAPRDVEKHDSRESIAQVLTIGMRSLNVYPDGYFYPDRLVTRARMAVVLQDALMLLKNSAILSTVYVGADSPYLDVHPEYYAFNAIMLCTLSGIMEPVGNAGEQFDPEGTVSGIDAILMIRSFEKALDTPLSVFYEQAGYPMGAR